MAQHYRAGASQWSRLARAERALDGSDGSGTPPLWQCSRERGSAGLLAHPTLIRMLEEDPASLDAFREAVYSGKPYTLWLDGAAHVVTSTYDARLHALMLRCEPPVVRGERTI